MMAELLALGLYIAGMLIAPVWIRAIDDLYVRVHPEDVDVCKGGCFFPSLIWPITACIGFFVLFECRMRESRIMLHLRERGSSLAVETAEKSAKQ